jgi:hypothetical protein
MYPTLGCCSRPKVVRFKRKKQCLYAEVIMILYVSELRKKMGDGARIR